MNEEYDQNMKEKFEKLQEHLKELSTKVELMQKVKMYQSLAEEMMIAKESFESVGFTDEESQVMVIELMRMARVAKT